MKRFFLNNWQLKLTSLLLAFGLWLYVNMDRSPEFSESISVPVVYENLNKSLTMQSKDDHVRIVVKGSSALIAQASPGDFRATANLARFAEGAHEVPVNVVEKPRFIEVLSIDLKAKVELVRIAEKRLPVKAVASGSLPVGLTLGEVKATPDEASLKGPSEALESVQILAAQISLNERGETFQEVAELQALDAEGQPVKGVEIDPPQANVLVSIEDQNVSIDVPVQLRYAEDIPDEFDSADLKTSRISLSGPGQFLADVKKIFTQKLDAASCLDKGTVKLELIVPEGLTANQSEVEVSCKRKKGPKGRMFDNVNVDVGRRNAGYDIEITPKTVRLLLEGDEGLLDTIRSDQLFALVHVDGLGDGSHQVAVIPQTFPEMNVKIKSDPAKVTVKLKKME